MDEITNTSATVPDENSETVYALPNCKSLLELLNVDDGTVVDCKACPEVLPVI
jgi:hypothetical protein